MQVVEQLALKIVTQTDRPSVISSAFCVPYDRNPYFTGRADLLETLARELSKKPNSYTHRVSLYGLGGVGKTQIALEYAYSHKAEYNYVFWISGVDQAHLFSGFGDIAKNIHCVEQIPGQSAADLAQAVLKWLRETESWLLIIDSLDDITIVEGYLPLTDGTGHTLITTRNSDSEGIPAEGIEVSELDKEDSVQFLLHRSKLRDTTSPEVQREAQRIVDELGYLPLALEQAATYIRQSQNIEEFWEAYQESRQELLDWRPKGNHPYKFTVATTWRMSLERLQSLCASAITLIQCFAFLNADEIMIEFLEAGKKSVHPELSSILKSRLQLRKCLTALESFSLINIFGDGRKVRIHRLVQTVIRDELDREQRVVMLSSIIRLGLQSFPDMVRDESKRKICRVYHAPVAACLIHEEARSDSEWDILAGRLTGFLILDGFYRESLKWSDLVFRSREQILGAEHSETLLAQTNLAISLQNVGREGEAIDIYESVLAIQKKSLGPNHPDTLRTMHNLASSLRGMGRVEEAVTLYKEALKIHNQLPGAKRRNTLRLMYGLASAYHSLGQVQDAVKMCEETLEIQKTELGREHPDTLHTMNELASAYCSLGKIKEGEQLYKETLEIQKAVLGSENPDTLRARHGLATTFWDLGRFNEAIKMYQEIIVIQKGLLGPEHPETLRSMDGLAWSYDSAGQFEDALALFQQVLELRKVTRGAEHRDTLNSMEGLAVSLNKLGRSEEALKLHQQTLEIRKRVLGPDHERTLCSMEGLADTFSNLGRMEEARRLHENTFELRKRELGPEHPSTLRSMYTVAELLEDLEERKRRHEEILEIRKKVLGLEHPETLQSMKKVGSSVDEVKQLQKSSMLECVRDIRDDTDPS